MSVQQYWLFSSVECGVSRLGDWWSNMLYQVSVLIHYCCIIVWRTLPCCFDLRFDEFANFSLLRASWWFLIRMVNKSWLRFSHLYDYKHHQHHWLWGHWQCWFFFIIVFFTDLVLKVFFFATFLVIPLPVQVAQPVFFSLQSYCWCQYCWLLYSSALRRQSLWPLPLMDDDTDANANADDEEDSTPNPPPILVLEPVSSSVISPPMSSPSMAEEDCWRHQNREQDWCPLVKNPHTKLVGEFALTAPCCLTPKSIFNNTYIRHSRC